MGNKKDNDKVLKFLIVPLMFVSFLGLFVYPPLRLAFGLYLVMSLWALNAYRLATYKEEIYGIRKKIVRNYLIGLGVGGGFLLLSVISPSFSLLTPTLSFSVSEDIRWVIIVILAPLVEEVWRSSTMGYIRDIYKTKFRTTNIIQALMFAALHTLVYGLAFNAYDTWVGVYGGFYAIGGSLLAAFIFGLISGYMMEKFQDIIPSIGAHQIINFWLVREGLIVIANLLPLIINGM